MGCGASKNDVIKSAGKSDKKVDEAPGERRTQSSAKSNASTIPANEAYQNGGSGWEHNNGGSGSLTGPGKNPRSLPPLKPLRSKEKPPEPVAFDIPASEGDASLIKRHPPRRLRQMEDKSQELTQEEIQEKVALANERRNQVLTQRVASARQKSAVNRVRRPVLESEQYSMAEYESELMGELTRND